MLKFGLLTVIGPLLEKLERTHPVLPGQPRLGRRRTYATWLLVRLWLLGVLGGWSERQLFIKLGNRPVRRWLGRFIALPATLPDRSQFARRIREPDFLEALRLLFEELARRLARKRPADLATLSLDFTDLPVNVRHDPDAAYGYSSKGRFYGYSLHLVITRRGALLAYRLATANHHAVRLAEEMTADLRPLRRRIASLLGDSSYDSGPFHERVRCDLGARLLAPPNRRSRKGPAPPPDRTTERGRALALFVTPRGQALYRQRTIIEQVNGQLKDVLHIGDIPYYVRGEAAVERLVAARLILYHIALLKNILDQKTHIRHVKALVA